MHFNLLSESRRELAKHFIQTNMSRNGFGYGKEVDRLMNSV